MESGGGFRAFIEELSRFKNSFEESKERLSTERELDISRFLDAAHYGHLNGVKFFIERKRVNVNSIDEVGNSALHEAAFGGHNEIVEYLISKGAEIDIKTQNDNPKRCGVTPFSYAVFNGRIDTVKTLIKHGADTKIIVNGFNFLDMAIKSDNPEMIKLALSYGYDIDQCGVGEKTPLTRALLNCDYNSAKFLLETRADYKKCFPDSYEAPLFAAVYGAKKDARALKLLLEHVEKKEGKEGLLEYINSRDPIDGRTALHFACIMHNSDSVEILLEYGADASIKDDEGLLASDILNQCEGVIPDVWDPIKSLLQQKNQGT